MIISWKASKNKSLSKSILGKKAVVNSIMLANEIPNTKFFSTACRPIICFYGCAIIGCAKLFLWVGQKSRRINNVVQAKRALKIENFFAKNKQQDGFKYLENGFQWDWQQAHIRSLGVINFLLWKMFSYFSFEK